MVIEKFDLGSWRASLLTKTSKLKAADMLGVGKNAYNRYEKVGECPKVVAQSALWVRHKQVQDEIDKLKERLR